MHQISRLIGKVPTIAAMSYRHSLGFPYVYPDNDLSYTENFMNMLWKMVEPKYVANPALARALDILFILHADHEQNCSTNAMRSVGSSQADPYLSVASAASALAGPLHGGANEEVLKMLDEIGSKDHVPAYIKRVKAGEIKLMGFGHRIYKNYDPRAKIIRWSAEQVFEVTGRNPKLDIALELERIALGRRLLREAQTLSQRRLLFRHHVPGDGLPAGDVHRAVRDSAHGGMAGAVAGIDHRSGAENRAAAPGLYRSMPSGNLCRSISGFRCRFRRTIRRANCVAFKVKLRGVLRQFGETLAVTLRRSDDLHLLPVIGKLSAAIETSDIRSGQSRSLGPARGSANAHRKAVTGVFASKNCIYQLCDHHSTFHKSGWFTRVPGI